jgi:hypothetical protein
MSGRRDSERRDRRDSDRRVSDPNVPGGKNTKKKGGRDNTGDRAGGLKTLSDLDSFSSFSAIGSEDDNDDDDEESAAIPTCKRKDYRSAEWIAGRERNSQKKKKRRAEQRAMEADPDYWEVEEEVSDLEDDLAGTGENQKNTKVKLDNNCMPQWMTDSGKIAISKFNLEPEKGVKREDVVQLLGSKAKQMREDDIERVIRWFTQLKFLTHGFMRERITEEILKNSDDLGLGWNKIKDLQDAWANSTNLEQTAETLVGIVEGVFFSKRRGLGALNWQEELEVEFMAKYDLVYSDEEKKMKKRGALQN